MWSLGSSDGNSSSQAIVRRKGKLWWKENRCVWSDVGTERLSGRCGRSFARQLEMRVSPSGLPRG